jgi:hypothetical protein
VFAAHGPAQRPDRAIRAGQRIAHHKFDEIVAGLTAEHPDFGNPPTHTWSRRMRASLSVLAAMTWAGLSILMVVWGWIGVLITVAVIAGVLAAGYARRRGRYRLVAPPDRHS